MNRKLINDFIRKNQNLSRRELAKKCGVTINAIQLREQSMDIKREWKSPQKPVSPERGDMFLDSLHTFLKFQKKTMTLEQLSDHFNCGITRIKTAMEQLSVGGHNIRIVSGAVELSRDIPKSEPTKIDVGKLKGRVVRFGLTADNHLGSKYCRLDVLNALFDIWEREGIKTVYQLGNMIDGEERFNKFDIIAYGINGQADYFADNWPRRDGMTTYFITGDDHEGWYVQREGIDIGRFLEDTAIRKGRGDLKYLGHMEHDICFTGKKQTSIMRLVHAGGGSAYATSYSVQKIVESYQGGEKPHILLVGHYHKAEYGYPREVHVLQAG